LSSRIRDIGNSTALFCTYSAVDHHFYFRHLTSSRYLEWCDCLIAINDLYRRSYYQKYLFEETICGALRALDTRVCDTVNRTLRQARVGMTEDTASPAELEDAIKLTAAIGRIKLQAREDLANKIVSCETALDQDMRAWREVDSAAIDFVNKLVKSMGERDDQLKESLNTRKMAQCATLMSDLQRFDAVLRCTRKEVRTHA
jgi:hypothetical protein